MAPIVHGLEVEYFNKVNFVYLDVDDPANTEYLKKLGYKYQPHFLLVDGQGSVLKQWLGPVGAGDFRTAFDSYLK